MNKEIIDRLKRAIEEEVFPGCVLGVVSKNGERRVHPAGSLTYDASSPPASESTIYDVASITKSVPGSCALLKLIDDGKLSPEDRLVNYVPEFGNFDDKKEVRIKHLLTFTLDLDVPPMSSLKNTKPEEIIQATDRILKSVIEAPLKNPPGSSYLYTNSTALFTGFIVEKITGLRLDQFADDNFFKPIQMTNTTFRPETLKREAIAPTEIDDWRGRLIQGEVHDESTYVLSQKYVVGIAGLFSTVPDLLSFEEMLLNDGVHENRRYFSPEIVREMHTNQIADIRKSAGLGWEIDAPIYMGRHFSKETFGMTGFTGCLMLIDPLKEVGFVLLSNRTYPHRPENSEAINEVRRDVADIIFGDGFSVN